MNYGKKEKLEKIFKEIFICFKKGGVQISLAKREGLGVTLR
jgi:hypothetical protein